MSGGRHGRLVVMVWRGVVCVRRVYFFRVKYVADGPQQIGDRTVFRVLDVREVSKPM